MDRSIPLREATWGDVPQLAKIAVAAFDGSTSMEYLFPGMYNYPGDYYDSWYEQLRGMFFAANVMVLVKESGGENSLVVGFAVWKFTGTASDGLDLRKQSLYMKSGRKLSAWQTTISSFLHKNRAISTEHHEALFEAARAKKKELWPQGMPIQWNLSRLAVDPEWQHKGFGTELTEWGLEQADKDQVICFLSSSLMARSLYKSLGFEEVGDIWCGEPWPCMIRKPRERSREGGED